MAFRNYLEGEDDKPYFHLNSLAHYYEKMEGFAAAVENAAKTLNLTKEEIEQRITERLHEWDGKLEGFDGSVTQLLTEWVDDGTLNHIIDTTLIDQKVAPLTKQLEEKVGGQVKLKPEEFSDEAMALVTGNGTVNVLSIPQDGSVSPKKHSDFKEGKNLFNKDTAIIGKYVTGGAGTLLDNPIYFSSDFIEISPNVTYNKGKNNKQFAYYANNTVDSFISGDFTSTVFTAPTNAKYVRISGLLTDLNFTQVEKGSVETAYESYKYELKYLSVSDPKVLGDLEELKTVSTELQNSSTGYLKNAVAEIYNPFVKTQVKLLGDSITAGTSGTGYSPTGDVIITVGSTTYRENLLSATNWANSLTKYLMDNFNKDHVIGLNNPNISKEFPVTYFYWNGAGAGSLPALRLTGNINMGGIVGKKMTFKFYGDHFSLLYVGRSNTGIVDVVIDGVLYESLNTYSATETPMKRDITGLSLANHTVELVMTLKAADKPLLWLQGLIIPKTVIVKRWGIAGINSSFPYSNTAMLSTDDDISIMQLGTNDRSANTDAETTATLQREVIKRMISLGIKPILMSSIPAVNELHPNYTMKDVDNAISKVAKEFNMEYISNYKFFKEYMKFTGTALNTLLADGLHPNDNGYDLMYSNIMDKLGFGRV